MKKTEYSEKEKMLSVSPKYLQREKENPALIKQEQLL
jgi:hypothetical protein